MKTKMIALATAVMTAMAFAPVAEAGGGVRLGFGGPLGTFTAKPSHGGASKAAYGSRKAHAARKHAKRKQKHTPSVREAARKSKAPAARPERATAETAPVVLPLPKKAPTKIAKAHTEEAAPLTGSSALIQAAIPEASEDADIANDEEVVEETTEDKPVQEAETETAETVDTAATCSKFIPAVGMTVTVGCDE